MSDYERNKGKLIPVSKDWKEVADHVVGDNFPTYYDDRYEFFQECAEDVGYVILKGKLYKIEWEVQGAQDVPDFAEVTENGDGSLSFHTYHYNGSAHWTEVVEGAL